MAGEERQHLDTATLGGATAPPSDPRTNTAFEPGTRVGEYEVLSAVGVGGMGEVYRVRNVISDRIEAMKVLLPSLTKDPNLAERFMREIKVQAALNHPNIASLHTAFRHNDQIIMIMEFVDGVPLDQQLSQGPIPLSDCLAYVTQVLRALSYAHEHGVVHRDLKPANIMLLPNGSVKLMDFGIAQVASDPKLTGTGVTVGSPYYMSPEQIRGQTPDERSDIYSLGITLYHLVTGRRPIQGDSQFSIMAAHLNDVPTPPIVLDHTLPPELNDIILMSIAKLPEQRFQTAAAFLNALESVRVKLPGHAASSTAPRASIVTPLPPPPALPVTERAHKSHRALYMALGASAAVLVLAVLGLEAPKWLRTSAHGDNKAATQTAPPTPVAAEKASTPSPSASPVPVLPEEKPTIQPLPSGAPVAGTLAPSGPTTARPATTHVATAQPQLRPPDQPSIQPSTQTPPPERPSTSRQEPTAAPPVTPPAPAASAAELEKVEERMSQMSARMNSLDRSLQRLEQSQNASGLGMRSDWAQARDLMHSYFNQAEGALRNQNPEAANRHLDRAETQVDKLAKALNQ